MSERLEALRKVLDMAMACKEPTYGEAMAMTAVEELIAEAEKAETTPGGIDKLAHEVIEANGGVPWPIERILVISTAHISQETGEWLSAFCEGTITTMISTHGNCGWQVYALSYLDHWPADLKHVLEFAKGCNCTWVMFDSDGDKIADLPEFDW